MAAATAAEAAAQALEAELRPLKLAALQERARREGCTEADVAAAVDADNPILAVRKLILSAAAETTVSCAGDVVMAQTQLRVGSILPAPFLAHAC